MKQEWKPGTMIYPLPSVMVSVGTMEGEKNIITVAWTGTICSEPPMCYISVRKERHSYDILRENMEFVINLSNRALARATDWCGVTSGKRVNKFTEMKLTPIAGTKTTAPMIAESPMNIECRVKEIIPLGSHDMFIADVLSVHADEQYINPDTGAFSMEKADLITYAHGEYFTLGEYLGHFGFSVKKDGKPIRRK